MMVFILCIFCVQRMNILSYKKETKTVAAKTLKQLSEHLDENIELMMQIC